MRKERKTIQLKDILVEGYAAEGKCISRVDGKVIFIENVIPGDVVDIQLSKNKKDWAEGFPIEFKVYAPDRVVPFCSDFGVCGGCQWQSLPYEKQIFYKREQVFDNLTRISKLDLPEIPPVIAAKETRYYRNKLEFTFCNKKFIPSDVFRKLKANGEAIINEGGFSGFHAKGVFDKIVAIDTCHLQEEPTNDIRKFIESYAHDNGLTFYDIRSHQGWLRNVIIRIARTGEIMVNVVLGAEDEVHQQGLLNALIEAFPTITTLLYTINRKFNDSIYDLEPKIHHGKGYIIEKLGEMRYKISPKSFFQTNSAQAEKLYEITREFAELKGTETLYDLYCGTGSIGIFMSRFVKKLIGVELIDDAIKDAKENAALNNILHSVFVTGDVITICDDQFFEIHGKPDVIITDPPRAGMHEKLVNKLLEIEAPIVVYVSCNPSTQARDIALLGEKYKVTRIQPVDMFPHTHHIENVIQLKLKKQEPGI